MGTALHIIKQIDIRQSWRSIFSHLSLNTTATFFGSFVHCSWSRHDVGRIWKRFRPVRGHCHVHLAEHSTRSVVLLNVSLHRADESQVARNSCPRLPRLILGLVSDQIFYRSCVNLQHFRSRSLAYFITIYIYLSTLKKNYNSIVSQLTYHPEKKN